MLSRNWFAGKKTGKKRLNQEKPGDGTAPRVVLSPFLFFCLLSIIPDFCQARE